MGKVTALLLLCVYGALAAAQRSFTFAYALTVKDVPAGAHIVDIWLPVPHDDPFQSITNLRVGTPYHYEIATGAERNRILHIRVAEPQGPVMQVTVRFDAVRKEHIQPLPAAPLPSDGAAAGLAGTERYLQPDRLVPLDDTIRRWAHEVVEAAGARTDLEMARAVYNHVAGTARTSMPSSSAMRAPWGFRPASPSAFRCPPIAAPAKSQAIIAGPNSMRPAFGWVPVDASEAAKNPARREYFFGAHDENRIEFSEGRDVQLVPQQQGAALNYFVYPYVEVDGGKYTTVETTYSYADVPI
jgi:hypothetical protein